MKFRAGALEFNAAVAEASESPSPQTGDPLRTLTIQFRAQKIEMHEQALVEVEQRRSGGLFSLGDAGQPDLEWRVRESRSSYVGTEPWGINHHIWRIEQVERLACSLLVVGPVELEPYDYAEAVSDDGIVRLVARARISPADLDTLSMSSDVVPVRRVGISDTSRPMTLAYTWGQRPDGLAIVVRCVDSAPEPRLTLDSAILADDALGDLIVVLSAKGILDDADAAHLRRLRHVARHVSNIDAWSLTNLD
jgi:hypothetical protein